MTLAAPEQTAELERKIDALSEQVAFLAEEARLNRQRRQRWEDLQNDVMPIAGEAMIVLSNELEELDVKVADLTALLRRLVKAAPVLDRALGQVEMYSELAHDVMPLGGEAMEFAVSRLANLGEKGYFTFAQGAMQVADRIVTGFTEDDIEQLGDNIVLILQTVKEMTQPEIMAALHRMIEAVQIQQRHIAAESSEPPSFFQIVKQMRDPEIRRGIARGLNTLRAVSEVETASVAKGLSTTNSSGGKN